MSPSRVTEVPVRRSYTSSKAPAAETTAASDAQDRAEMLAEECRQLELARSDSAAFGWFFERYDLPILQFLRSAVRNHDDAQELHDRVFLQALANLGRYRWQGLPYGAYLHRIAANAAASYWRDRRRRQHVDADGAPPLPDPRPDALQSLVSEEEAQHLREAIANMSESDQAVLTMYYWRDLSTVQIAAELQIPPGTVQARLKRARDKLERTLADSARRESRSAVPETRITWLAVVLKRQLGLRRDAG